MYMMNQYKWNQNWKCKTNFTSKLKGAGELFIIKAFMNNIYKTSSTQIYTIWTEEHTPTQVNESYKIIC